MTKHTMRYKPEFMATFLSLVMPNAGNIGILRVESGDELDADGCIEIEIVLKEGVDEWTAGFNIGFYSAAAIRLK